MQLTQPQAGKHVQITPIPLRYTSGYLLNIRLIQTHPGYKHDANKCEVSRFYRSHRPYKNPADHIDSADRSCRPTDKSVHIMQIVHTPIPVYRSYRTHRFHSGRSCFIQILQVDDTHTDKHVQIMQIVQTLSRCRCTIGRSDTYIPSRSNCTDCTDYTDSTHVHIYEICNRTDRCP